MIENHSWNAADLAAELGVSPQTLRNWTQQFAPFLSPSGPFGDGARQFTEEDLRTLRRIKDLLATGLSFDETAEELVHSGSANGAPSPPDEATGGFAALTVPSAQQGFGVLAETLRAMVENQQTIQNSLQVNRNLLGVIIQDNFNLKEENAKLRERMLKLEQELEEQKRRDADYRLYLEQRINMLDTALRAEIAKSVWQKLLGG